MWSKSASVIKNNKFSIRDLIIFTILHLSLTFLQVTQAILGWSRMPHRMTLYKFRKKWTTIKETKTR